MKIFDTSYTQAEGVVPTNHGKIWSTPDLTQLKAAYQLGENLKSMCELLGRSPDGIIAKLTHLGLIVYDSCKGYYVERVSPTKWEAANWTEASQVYVGFPSFCPSTQDTYAIPKSQPKGETMNIETKTFIDGTDATNLTDDQIFAKIAGLESAIEKWEKVKNQPKKLKANLAKLREDVQALVDYVDGR